MSYYYGQGRISLASLSDEHHRWHWIGDASEFSVDLTFDEKQKKTSIGGRLVTAQRYIAAVAGSVSIAWHELSYDNLQLLFNATNAGHRQGWQKETFRNVTAGTVIALQYHHVRRVEVEGLREGFDYIVNASFGSIEFLVTPPAQPVTVSYDFAEEHSLEILNAKPQEFILRFDGINLADDGAPTNIELYRLSFDPAVIFDIINNGGDITGIQTITQLLPDFTRLSNSDMGLFGRFITQSEFKLITYNGAINYDGTYEHVY